MFPLSRARLLIERGFGGTNNGPRQEVIHSNGVMSKGPSWHIGHGLCDCSIHCSFVFQSVSTVLPAQGSKQCAPTSKHCLAAAAVAGQATGRRLTPPCFSPVRYKWCSRPLEGAYGTRWAVSGQPSKCVLLGLRCTRDGLQQHCRCSSAADYFMSAAAVADG